MILSIERITKTLISPPLVCAFVVRMQNSDFLETNLCFKGFQITITQFIYLQKCTLIKYFRSLKNVTVFQGVAPVYAYLCLDLNKAGPYSYYYYQNSGNQHESSLIIIKSNQVIFILTQSMLHANMGQNTWYTRMFDSIHVAYVHFGGVKSHNGRHN